MIQYPRATVCVVQFVKCLFHTSEILLIYLNDLCCFRVLCYVLVLQCGNSPGNCCVFSSGVSQWVSEPRL